MSVTSRQEGGRTSTRGAESAHRALDLLFAFSEDRPRAAIKDLAAELDMPLPTAHRYMALLRERGLVEPDDRGRYHLTMRVSALDRAARRASPLLDVAEPHLRALAGEIGETVIVVRLVDGLPVCVHRVEADRRLRLSFEPGQNLPALSGASMKVLVGGLSERERRAYVERARAAGWSGPEGHDDARVLADIDEAHRQGWAVSSQEIDEGVWAAAAAVVEDGRTVATVSAACADFRLDDDRRRTIIERVRATAGTVSAALR